MTQAGEISNDANYIIIWPHSTGMSKTNLLKNSIHLNRLTKMNRSFNSFDSLESVSDGKS